MGARKLKGVKRVIRESHYNQGVWVCSFVYDRNEDVIPQALQSRKFEAVLCFPSSYFYTFCPMRLV